MRLIAYDYMNTQLEPMEAIGFENGSDRIIFLPESHLLVRIVLKLLSKIAARKKAGKCEVMRNDALGRT